MLYMLLNIAILSHQSKLEQKLKLPSNIEAFHLPYKDGSFNVFNVSDVPLSHESQFCRKSTAYTSPLKPISLLYHFFLCSPTCLFCMWKLSQAWFSLLFICYIAFHSPGRNVILRTVRIHDNVFNLHDCTWGIFFILLLK